MTYYLQVYSNADATGGTWLVTPRASNAVPNDNVAFAVELAFPAPDTDWTGALVNITDASTEPGENTWAYSPSRTAWWKFTPTQTTVVAVGASTPNGIGHPHTMVTLRASSSVSAPFVTGCLAWSGTQGCLSSSVTLTGGQTYWLQIDGGNPLTAPRIRTFLP